jgi:hypothetical protein
LKIELSWKGEVVLALVIAAVFGALSGGLIGYGYSYSPVLNVLRNDLAITAGSSVTAQSLQGEMGESFSFPPPLYVWEWLDFEVDVSSVSGGTLEVNFTRDDGVLRTELLHDSSKIVLSGFGKYRLGASRVDVTLRAVDQAVSIRSLFIDAHQSVTEYNPLLGAVGFTLVVGITILPFAWRRESQ